MKGDTPAAALRLMAQLPIRTVEHRPPERVYNNPGNPYGKRAVLLGGVRYETVRDARKAHRIGYQRFYDMIETGEAKYVK